MEKFVEQALLYDFYCELLTEHQKRIYEDVVFNDLSLSEVAEQQNISRQGVHDLIKRCDRSLRDYEAKLGLVRKFEETRRLVGEIHRLAREFDAGGDASCVKKIEQISEQIGEL